MKNLLKNHPKIKMLRPFFEALHIVQQYSMFSNLTEAHILVVEQGMNVERSALSTLEAVGKTLPESIIYAQAAKLGARPVEEVLEQYPTEEACAKFVEEVHHQMDVEAAPLIVPAAVPQTSYDDPKEYLDAPYTYSYSDRESVSLNSGSLELTTTDFSLPGRNGFDLELVRRYSSSAANTMDVDVDYNNQWMGTYIIWWDFTLRGINGNSGTYSGKAKVYQSSQIYHTDVIDDRANDDVMDFEEVLAVGQEIDIEDWLSGTGREGWYRITKSVVTFTRQKGNYDCLFTGARDNSHLLRTYGLGHGWSFALPSIEIVPENQRKSKIVYKNFLHLGDGRAYQISGNTLKDYTLKDIAIQKTSGNVSTPYNGSIAYDYILTYKDGRAAYFQAQKSGTQVVSYKLVAMQDRFLNTITYRFTDNGGLSITDSVGRVVNLVKTSTGLEWRLDGSDTIRYAISGNKLDSVTDQVGRTTRYNYTTQTAKSCYYGSDYNDPGYNIPYCNMTEMIHPTGARSLYGYGLIREKASLTDGYRQYFGLTSRRDMEGSNTLNQVSYAYNTNSGNLKYVGTTTVTRPDAVVSTHTFGSNHLQTAQSVTHAGKKVLDSSYTYNSNKLLTRQVDNTYNAANRAIQRVYAWTYDDKGNLLTETDPMNTTTTYTYHALYCLPLSKETPKDSSVVIREEYTLRSDSKVMQWHKVFEKVNGVLQSRPVQAIQYRYDTNHNLCEEMRYYGDLSALNQWHSKLLSYANTNTSLPTNFNGAFLTQVETAGVLDVDGQLAYTDGIVREKWMYDWYGRTIQQIDALGNTTKTTYDSIGRIVQVTHPDGSEKLMQYDDSNNTLTTVDENGTRSLCRYTPLGKMQSMSDLENGFTLISYEYDNQQRTKREIQHREEGKRTITEYGYDRFHRTTAKTISDDTGAILSEDSYIYDDAFSSALTKETHTVLGDSNAPAITTTVYRNKNGWEERKGFFLDGVEYIDTYTLDKRGNQTAVLTALDARRGLSYTTKRELDFAGRVLKEYNALGDWISYQYDALGNKVAFTDAKGNRAAQQYSVSFSYDCLGRLLQQTTPFTTENGVLYQKRDRYGYDPCGNVLWQESSRGLPTAPEQFSRKEYQYDNRNREISCVCREGDRMLSQTAYEYDGLDNRTAIRVGSGTQEAITHYDYNKFGKPIHVIDPMGREEQYTYDNLGNLIEKRDRNGNTTHYLYDPLNRVISERVLDPSGTQLGCRSFSYTRTGEKLAESNDVFSVTYRYDELGRLSEEEETGDVRKLHRYDSEGNRLSFTLFRNNATVLESTFEYDRLNRLSTVKEQGELVAAYTYDMNGNRASLRYADGTETTYTYTVSNLVEQLTNSKGGQVVSSYRYKYDLNGSQASVAEHGGRAVSYEYDSLGRLIREEDNQGLRLTYEYDLLQNRTKMTSAGDQDYIVQYSYDLDNRLTREAKRSVDVEEITSYMYDANGNEVSREKEWLRPANAAVEGTVEFQDHCPVMELRQYNGFGELTHLFVGGQVATYAYRPDGLRFQKTADDTSHLHVWDKANLVAEFQEDSGAAARYIRGINLLAREDGSCRQYYLFNAHGDVVQLCDADGAQITKYAYDAFGNLLPAEEQDTAHDPNPFRYCGEYFDAETQTIYLRARYYRPTTGRFSSQDVLKFSTHSLPNNLQALDPLSLNRYTYGYNNPNLYADASGQIAVAIAVGIGVTFLGLIALHAFQQEIYRAQGVADSPRLPSYKDLMDAVTGGLVAGAVGLHLFTKWVEDVQVHSREAVEAKTKKDKIFQLAFISPSGDLIRLYPKFTMQEAYEIAQGALKLDDVLMNVLLPLADGFGIDTSGLSDKQLKNALNAALEGLNWGLYTHDQKDARIMANMLGIDTRYTDHPRPDVWAHYHGSGMYPHYNIKLPASGTEFHVWYGGQIQ